jgi:hypothetical protein
VSRSDGEVCDCLNPMCSHRSARPAAPAVEGDLRESLADTLAQVFTDTGTCNIWEQADALLAGPLRSLVEQAAEATRLRREVNDTKLQRHATIWHQDGWWMVSLQHKNMVLGNLPWPTWTEARDAALRWTEQARP